MLAQAKILATFVNCLVASGTVGIVSVLSSWDSMASGGNPSSLRVVIPERRILDAWSVIDDARSWIGCPPNIMKEVLTLMGDGGATHLVLFGASEPSMMRRVVNEVVIEVGGDGDEEPRKEPRGLSPFERTQIALIYNAARVKIGLETVDILEDTPSAPVAEATALQGARKASGVAAAIGGTNKVSLSKVLDQAAEGEVDRLTETEIEGYRRHYRCVMTADPTEEQDFTDEQLSALVRWTDAGRAPYTDFAVWRQYGNRLQRDLKFRVQVRESNGKFRNIEVSGPSCWEAWETSWLVFKAAAVAMSMATGPTLDLYAYKIKERAKDYPQAWYLLMKADIIMRSEEWKKAHRRLARLHAAAPQLSERLHMTRRFGLSTLRGRQ